MVGFHHVGHFYLCALKVYQLAGINMGHFFFQNLWHFVLVSTWKVVVLFIHKNLLWLKFRHTPTIFAEAPVFKKPPLFLLGTCHYHRKLHRINPPHFSTLKSRIFNFVSLSIHQILMNLLSLVRKWRIICLVIQLIVCSQVWKITCTLLTPIFMPFFIEIFYLWLWTFMGFD